MFKEHFILIREALILKYETEIYLSNFEIKNDANLILAIQISKQKYQHFLNKNSDNEVFVLLFDMINQRECLTVKEVFEDEKFFNDFSNFLVNEEKYLEHYFVQDSVDVDLLYNNSFINLFNYDDHYSVIEIKNLLVKLSTILNQDYQNIDQKIIDVVKNIDQKITLNKNIKCSKIEILIHFKNILNKVLALS